MSEQEMAETRDELADAALKNYEELVKAAWPNGSSLSTIPQAIEAWRNLPALEARLSKMEGLLRDAPDHSDIDAAAFQINALEAKLKGRPSKEQFAIVLRDREKAEAKLEKALGVISMLEHHWISPMEYYEATAAFEADLLESTSLTVQMGMLLDDCKEKLAEFENDETRTQRVVALARRLMARLHGGSEVEECAHPNAISAKNEVIESGLYCPDCRALVSEIAEEEA